MFTKLYTDMCVRTIFQYKYVYTNICIQIYVYKCLYTNMCIQIYVYGMCIQTEIFKYSNLIKTKKIIKTEKNRKVSTYIFDQILQR